MLNWLLCSCLWFLWPLWHLLHCPTRQKKRKKCSHLVLQTSQAEMLRCSVFAAIIWPAPPQQNNSSCTWFKMTHLMLKGGCGIRFCHLKDRQTTSLSEHHTSPHHTVQQQQMYRSIIIQRNCGYFCFKGTSSNTFIDSHPLPPPPSLLLLLLLLMLLLLLLPLLFPLFVLLLLCSPLLFISFPLYVPPVTNLIILKLLVDSSFYFFSLYVFFLCFCTYGGLLSLISIGSSGEQLGFSSLIHKVDDQLWHV